MGEFLVLNEAEVRQVLDLKTCNDLVERCFRAQALGRADNLPTVSLSVDDPKGRVNLKSGYLKEEQAVGVKVIAVYPSNPERGLAKMQCQILVLDLSTGALKGVVDGVYITRVRTGSAGAVGARFLARKEARRVAVIGAGVQGEAQLAALAADRALGTVKVWSRTAERRERYAREVGRQLGLEISPTASIEEAVREAEIIITATWSFQVIVENEWVQPGTYIAAIGADAPGMQELAPALLRRSKVVMDDFPQCARMGEINVPLAAGEYRKEDLHGTIGEVCAGLKPGRTSDDEITVFDSTGLGIQDAVAAEHAWRRALELGLGQKVRV